MTDLTKMTVRELEKELNVYESLVNGLNPCFGSRDVQWLAAIHDEIEKRGLEFDTKYKLYDPEEVV